MFPVVVIWVVAMVCVAAGGERVRRVLGRAARPVVGPLAGTLRPCRRPAPVPSGRPFEQVAQDVQRLGMLFHHPPPHLSFARWEGRRRAYDMVLGEACRALDVAHLLQVIPPSPELDRERQRVESLLDWSGLRLDDVA